MRALHQELLRLAGLLACIALAASRLGLLGHELVGHGGTALVLGGKISDVQLFWFAGGWIRYDGVTSGAAALAIAMGGIAVELIAGTALWIAVRGDSLGRRIMRGIGAAFVVHAAWYAANGAFSGFGDGVLLYRELGAARVPFAIGAGLVACGAAFVGARGALGALAATLSRHRIAGTIACVLVAGGLHAGLAGGELHLRRDATYTATMQPERERVIDRELARWSEHETTRGAAPTPEQRETEQARLAGEHPKFPFAWLLGAAVLVSVIAGAARTRAGPFAPVSRRLIAIAAITAAASIGAVIAIDCMLTM